MKGITILEDLANKKRYLQIDIAELDKRREQIEDMLDGLIAEQRAGQPTVSLDQLEKKLRKQGKLRATKCASDGTQSVTSQGSMPPLLRGSSRPSKRLAPIRDRPDARS